MTEDIFILRLRDGEEAAYKQLFREYYPLLCRFAAGLLGDRQQAEIVVDDVIFALWQNRRSLEIRQTLRAYMMAAVRNRCLNELHTQRRCMERLAAEVADEENADFMDVVFSDSAHPLGQLIERELEREIRRCVDGLPAECRTVFEMSRYDQMSYREIAAELGVSVNTVKYHIKHALAMLHDGLAEYLRVVVIALVAAGAGLQ